MFDTLGLSRLYSIIIITIVVVAAVSGGAAYVLLSNQKESSETIKIGILADLDAPFGSTIWKSVVLAAEQLNKEGGIIGKQVEVVGEDSDDETASNVLTINSALTRLLTYHNVDYVLGPASTAETGFMVQDTIAEHKKILISYNAVIEDLNQRVTDDYDTYKYFFKYYPGNNTQIFTALIDELLHARDIMGFNKIGYLAGDSSYWKGITAGLDNLLPDVYGFDLVYRGTFPLETLDFSSYFAAAEAAGVEILVPFIGLDNGIALVKEYNERQSPMVVYGGMLSAAGVLESWERTDNKCEYISALMLPMTVGYPLTNKTLPFRDSYIDRWGETPNHVGAAAYDIIRFILFDVLERAGTTETEAVIKALETTQVETSMARNFAFTSNHDVLYGKGMLSNPDDYGFIASLFQWQQDGSLVPVYPKWLMEEAGATYTFPDWPGPWDNP
ncbi:hypothetical protein AC477_05650 [miscellaneous Crenarchaeota group-1 archaeon SG8-32-1]|uniref:Leucine-binding protein domain-containing protein n=1 Tax=miscellaneous Crenarchaeota group-1 archaeon SG8-32-1 TaxID=1685124 RepID=A0A0M0BMV5_9ARCH|nr:MAG: hypothetical protein AC477_05650 [miscellaneous Crenarchaeota group-1 archaeon SG8-32-1]